MSKLPAKRTLEGSKVRLLRDIHTKGGVVFRRGVVMRIAWVATGGRGGKLTLSCFKRGWHKQVTGISSDDVEVIEWAHQEFKKHDFEEG